MYLLVIPMTLLITYIVIASSEAVLDQTNRYSPFERRDLAFILKNNYKEIRAQLRRLVSTTYPTPFLKYSK